MMLHMGGEFYKIYRIKMNTVIIVTPRSKFVLQGKRGGSLICLSVIGVSVICL